jgi:cbb3-type cytochrome oxidase subunit 3
VSRPARKAACLALALASGLSIALKLFTYEFHLADDPTTGVALRATPSLSSSGLLGRSASFGPDRVLLSDENGFLGEGLYRFFVQVGWMAFPLAALGCALWMLSARRRERRAYSGARSIPKRAVR